MPVWPPGNASINLYERGAALCATRRRGDIADMHLCSPPTIRVRLSFITALLRDAGIEATVLDTWTSSIEGSIGAIPRRVMVPDEDAARATRLLREAGET